MFQEIRVGQISSPERIKYAKGVILLISLRKHERIMQPDRGKNQGQ